MAWFSESVEDISLRKRMAKVSSINLHHEWHKVKNLGQIQKMLPAIIIIRKGNAKNFASWRNKTWKIKRIINIVNSISVADSEFDKNDVSANAFLVSLGIDSLIDSWILDSACSYHMYPNRQWFDTFKTCNAGTMLMGNDARCNVIGPGTIKVRIFERIVKILTNVKYIPDLKKNLISLGHWILWAIVIHPKMKLGK